MDRVTEFMTGVVVLLALIAAGIVLPFAWRELRRDWYAVRAQFAGAITLLFAGLAYRLGIAYYFWALSPVDRIANIEAIRPHVLVGNAILIAGILWIIRTVTVKGSGELGWIVSALAAIVSVAVPWLP